jgi:hypothetical protein
VSPTQGCDNPGTGQNERPRLLTILRIVIPLFLVSAPALAQTAGQRPMLYGNYCGPGNNAPLLPIDALDRACAHHDACTPADGLPTKSCNLRLEREAAAVSEDPREPDDVRAMARFVSMFGAMAEGIEDPVRPARIPRRR